MPSPHPRLQLRVLRLFLPMATRRRRKTWRQLRMLPTPIKNQKKITLPKREVSTRPWV